MAPSTIAMIIVRRIERYVGLQGYMISTTDSMQKSKMLKVLIFGELRKSGVGFLKHVGNVEIFPFTEVRFRQLRLLLRNEKFCKKVEGSQ